jgi:hypothetical protein
MDNYPAHLAPEFDNGGGVSTPFGEWWSRVKPLERPLLLYLLMQIERKALNRPSRKARVPRTVMWSVAPFFLVTEPTTRLAAQVL